MLPLLLKRHDATVFAAVPAVFRRLLHKPLPDFPKLRHALSAGEKLPEPVRTRWREGTGTDIHEAFGQTECSTFLSGSPERPAPPGTLGYVQPGRAVAIVGPNGPVERGTEGEIAVARSDPGLCIGTLNDQLPDLPEWVRTGDRGLMQIDGSIRYLGRADDVLTAGGFRISPVEIEEAFADFDGLTGIAVTDARVAEDTVVVAAYYTSSRTLDEKAMHDYAASRLAPHKRPRLFVRVEALPHSPNGKLLRKALPTAKPAPS